MSKEIQDSYEILSKELGIPAVLLDINKSGITNLESTNREMQQYVDNISYNLNNG